MTRPDLKVGDPVRYDGSPWYEGRIVGPARNSYVGWFHVCIYASSLPCRVGTYQDFAGYALRKDYSNER